MIRQATASAVVIDPQAELVLLVWHNATGKWMFPGGHVDDGETAIRAALREVFEETGVKAVPVLDTPIDVAPYAAPAKPDRPGKPAEAAHVHDDELFLTVADSTLPLTAAVSEVAEVRWQPIGQVADLDVRAEVPRVLASAVTLLEKETR